MSSKKGKDVIDENYWRRIIEDAPLDDENWKVKVVILESAGSDNDKIYLDKFETFAAGERRFVIKNICKTETLFMVNQLGGEKKVKDDNLHVFEVGQSFLKDKKDIPPDILALVIKHLILKMKEEYLYIKRQKLEVREGLRRESATMIDKTEVRGIVSVKPPEPIDLPPLPSRGKGKKNEPGPSLGPSEPTKDKKYNTSLRVRGEEWRDKVYVDDFPTDGPNIYVAITGFGEPHLPECLVKIGVPMIAVVQIRIDPSITKVPSSLLKTTKRGQSQTEILSEKCLKFWEELQQLRMQKETADHLKNAAFVVFSPPYWDTETLSGNPDKIYDEICFLLYDLQDLTRQHLHYLKNMDVINIPCETSDVRYKLYYYKQIECIPLECVTIYSVLDSILQTVSFYSELDEITSSSSSLLAARTINQMNETPSIEAKSEKIEKLVKDVFSRLCKVDEEKQSYRITYGAEFENHIDPVVINYGDFVKYSTFHLGNVNLDNIVWSTLLGMPVNLLWQNQKSSDGELEAKINFHINVLLSSFDREDVETSELNRLLHILSFRKLYDNKSSAKKRHLPISTITDFKKMYLKRSALVEPLAKYSAILNSSETSSLSFPSIAKSENMSDASYDESIEAKRIRFLFDCPDISELVSASEIATNLPMSHLIDDFEYFEDFTGIRAFQVMLNAFNTYNCIDYKYCEVTDCFLLMFHNSYDIDGVARDEWRGHLPTPLCLQDFFDFVLEEHNDWFQNEERIYDENITLGVQSELKDLIDPYAFKSCVQDNNVEMELLMEGSLKHQEIAQIEECSPDSSYTKITSSKKQTLSLSSTEPVSASSKKTKSTPYCTSKNLHQGVVASDVGSQTTTEILKKPFLGYDLGDRRVEIFGRDATYFSKDGTKVSSKYFLIMPMNLEYLILNVLPGNGSNEIWVHKALGKYVTEGIVDTCESFRITTKDQVLINIKKQVYQIPSTIVVMRESETMKPKQRLTKTLSTELSNFISQIYESQHFYSVYITWPNGLITESVHKNNSPTLSHIKQYYVSTSPGLDEDMRCVSLNGEVIIFRPSGIIEVLKPDSSYIKITKCAKRIIDNPEIIVPSESNSEKFRKIKSGKLEKSTKDNKGTKATNKSSIMDDKISEEKLIEYELFIEEFETVDTNAFRQKWILNNCFDEEKLLIRTATDYCLGEIFSRRMDGVNILLNKDGILVVTFPNGTRILTNFVIEEQEILPEWTEEEIEYFNLLESDMINDKTIESNGSISQRSNIEIYSYITSVDNITHSKKQEEDKIKENENRDGYISVKLIYSIEHPNFTTITINQINGNISIDSPNNATVTMDAHNHYNIALDNFTSAKFDGANLHIDYEACSECQLNTTCDIKIKTDEMSSFSKIHQNWLEMTDSFSKKIVVDEEGNISLNDEACSTKMLPTEEILNPKKYESNGDDEKIIDSKSETSITSHTKCREMYLAKTHRFFVLQR